MIKNAPYSSNNKAIKIQKKIEKGKLTKKQANNIIKKQSTSKLMKTKKNKKKRVKNK